MKVRFVNETDFVLEEELIVKCAEQTLEHEKKDGNTNIVFVGKDRIKDLNKKYYNKNKTTDVLSFESEEDDYLGEVVVCPEYIKENSKNFKWELCHTVVHGTLHLLGMHHDTEEERKKLHELEEQIINKSYGKG